MCTMVWMVGDSQDFSREESYLQYTPHFHCHLFRTFRLFSHFVHIFSLLTILMDASSYIQLTLSLFFHPILLTFCFVYLLSYFLTFLTSFYSPFPFLTHIATFSTFIYFRCLLTEDSQYFSREEMISLLRLWTHNRPFFDFPCDLSATPRHATFLPHRAALPRRRMT